MYLFFASLENIEECTEQSGSGSCCCLCTVLLPSCLPCTFMFCSAKFTPANAAAIIVLQRTTMRVVPAKYQVGGRCSHGCCSVRELNQPHQHKNSFSWHNWTVSGLISHPGPGQEMPERDFTAWPSQKHILLLEEQPFQWLPGERMLDLWNNGVKVYVKYISWVLKIPAWHLVGHKGNISMV